MKNISKKLQKRRIYFGLAIGLGAAVLLTTGCFGSRKSCTGEIAYQGKTFQGKAETEDQARQNTCSKYCIEGDPGFDSLYRQWQQSAPESEKSGMPVNNVESSKWWAQSVNAGLEKYVTNCTTHCLSDGEGKKINVSCQ